MNKLIAATLTLLSGSIIIFGSSFMSPSSVYAQDNCDPLTNNTGSALKADDLDFLPRTGCQSSVSSDTTLSLLLKFVWGLLAILSLIYVLIGSFKYTTSGGNSEAIASAKKTIIYAVLGLVLGISAFTITSLVVSGVG